MAQVAETLGCPKQTPGKPNPKDLRQEWPSSRQALGTSSFGDQGCNCGTVDLKPTAHRVPSPQGTDEGSSCVTLESHGPSLGSMSLWAGSLGVTGVSFGIQSLTPASQSLGKESSGTLGDFWEDPYTQGEDHQGHDLESTPCASHVPLSLWSRRPSLPEPSSLQAWVSFYVTRTELQVTQPQGKEQNAPKSHQGRGTPAQKPSPYQATQDSASLASVSPNA